MGVGIHRLRDGRVAQPFLGYFRVDTRRVHKRGTGVPEVVESDGQKSNPNP